MEKMKRVVFVISFLLICFCGWAQPFQKKEIPSYGFINMEMNKIQFFGTDTMRKYCFYEKLDFLIKMKKGRVNILHIGGSHVQADIFSNQVRLNLDAVNGDLKPNRGYIFPYETAKTNNPSNYEVTHKGEWIPTRNVKKDRVARLGLGGIAVSTKDPNAEISVKLNVDSTKKRWRFSRLRLMGYCESSNVLPTLKLGNSFLVSTYDSISSTYVFELSAPADSFTVIFPQKDTLLHLFTVTGFIPENDEYGIIYHSVGVNGASVPSYLSCPDFNRDMALIRPDLVIFGIGINDAVPANFSDSAFVAHYDSLIAGIENVSPGCLYLFVTNNDSFKKKGKGRRAPSVVNENGLKAQRAFYTLAMKHDGAVWDLFALMGGLSSMQAWQNAGLARKDKIHFTPKGYQLIGDMFYNALIEAYINETRRK
ncbi:MAG: GDSL-type esterase/lipase family protein [Paludibacteraceae bacterium]|nr:GDSL-type esterase/lipase family protein [Paludibacteraceae bacterium]